MIIASNNQNKIREIKQILGDKFEEILSQKEVGCFVEAEETGDTFLQNAIIKAKAVCKAVCQPVIADDSGLIAVALGNRPGVFSARYSGIHGDDAANNKKLIADLKGKDNAAYFITVCVLYYPDGSYIFAEGRANGYIIDTPRGNNGFGYDPIFYSTELNKTFAEATAEEKNNVSHRARALTALLKQL